MFTERLKLLGLDKHLLNQDGSYQVRMARDLRSLVFRYIEGTLTDIDGNPIPDGPAVKRFRDTLHVIGGRQRFIKEQSPDGAWATDIELTLLAELFNVTFVVEFHKKNTEKSEAVLSAVNTPDQPVVVLANTNNTHWDAVLKDGTIDKTTRHDGNCGYNAFAKSIAECCGYSSQKNNTFTEDSLEKRVQQNQDTRYQRSIEQYHQENAKFVAVHEKLKTTDPEKYAKTMSQIDSDYQYALRIALADLPGVQGRVSKLSVIPFSVLNHKNKTGRVHPVESMHHTFKR